MVTLNIDLAKEKNKSLKPKILVFGIGGAGGNAINNMIRSELQGVQFIAANTDSQMLNLSEAKNKLQLGLNTTKGLGAGSHPEIGKAAAEEAIQEIIDYLENANMVFITAGMGGGTGTGAAPIIAKLAKERDILTAAVVTKPFEFEGKHRIITAEKGIEELKEYVDTLIVVPNQNLFRIANIDTTVQAAFKVADDILHAGVRGITDLITMPGLINLDFSDVKTIMKKMGKAMMGTGEASGEDRALKAVEEAISNPLLDEVSIKGAKGAIVNITGSPDITLFEFDEAAKRIKEEIDSDANIIIGTAFNKDMEGKIRVSVFATGINTNEILDDIQEEIIEEIPKNETPKVSIKPTELVKTTPTQEIPSQNNGNFFDPGNPMMISEFNNKNNISQSTEVNPENNSDLFAFREKNLYAKRTLASNSHQKENFTKTDNTKESMDSKKDSFFGNFFGKFSGGKTPSEGRVKKSSDVKITSFRDNNDDLSINNETLNVPAYLRENDGE